MASNYDITFLRLLMEQQITAKPQAMHCLQVIDEQAQRGQRVNAAQAAVKMGLVDPQVAQRFDALTRAEIQRGAPPAGTGRFAAAPGAPAPMPGQGRPQHPSGQHRRPGPPGQHPSGAHRRPTGAYRRPGHPGRRPSGPQRRPSGAHRRPTGSHPRPGPPPQGAPLRPATGRHAHPSGSHPRPGQPSARASGRQQSATGRQSRSSSRVPGAFQDMGGELAGVECGPKIGRGPVGTTYEGRRDGQPVAIKVLSRRFAQHEGLVERLLAEARVFEGFSHPSLVGLLKVGSTEGRNVLVFQRARGKPIHEVVAEKGPLPPSAALRVIYDVAQVLSEAPASCGDVRAEKIFFDGQRAQLADLGLSRGSCLGSGHGAHGLPFGDPRYLAPEVMQEEQSDPTPAGDVYALGVLCYYLVCGVLPFDGDAQDVLAKQLESPLPPPPKTVSFSTKIAALILRMTAKSPAQRIPDPQTVVTVITQLLEGKPLSLPPIAGGSTQQAVEVDEFDLDALSDDDDDISADRWEATSKPMARHGSGEWDRKKIAAARGKGPQLDSMASDDNLSPMQAMIAEAAGDRPSASSRRSKAGKSGRSKSATSSRRSTRHTGVSDRPRRRKGTDKKALLRAVGGLGLVIAVMVGVSLIPEDVPPPITHAETGELFAPPPPPARPAVEDLQAQAAKVDSELDDYDDKVDARIKNRRFQEGMALADELAEELRNSQAGSNRIAAAEARIRAAADVEVEKAVARIRDLIGTAQYEKAKKLATRLGQWALDETLAGRLKKEADEAYLGRHREVRNLEAQTSFKQKAAATWLRNRMPSAQWGKRSRVYKKGGLVIDCGTATSALLEDLLRLHQDRHGPPPELKKVARLGNAIKLTASERTVTLLVPVKFERILDAAIEFVIPTKVEPDTKAEVAVFLGVDHRGRSGVGFSWGKFPVSLGPGRIERRALAGAGLDGFQAQARYRLEVGAAPGTSVTAYEGRLTNLVKKTSQQGSYTSDTPPRGYVAIVAQGVDVYLLGLEVRGVVDPSQFKSQ